MGDGKMHNIKNCKLWNTEKWGQEIEFFMNTRYNYGAGEWRLSGGSPEKFASKRT